MICRPEHHTVRDDTVGGSNGYLLVIDKPGEVSRGLRLVRGAIEVEEVSRVVVRETTENDWRLGRERDDQEVSVLTLRGEHWSLRGDLAPEPASGGEAGVDQDYPGTVTELLEQHQVILTL